MEKEPGQTVTRATEVEQEGVKINKIDEACRLLTASKVYLEWATVFQSSDDGCERRRRFSTLFTRKGACSRSSNVALENDGTEKTAKLIPLIPVRQQIPRPRKRFGKHFGTKIRYGFTKLGRAVRRIVAPSTETIPEWQCKRGGMSSH